MDVEPGAKKMKGLACPAATGLWEEVKTARSERTSSTFSGAKSYLFLCALASYGLPIGFCLGYCG